MKRILFSVFFLYLTNLALGQWTVDSPDIYFTGGKVGIGTTAPSKLLTIASGGNVYMRLAKPVYSDFFDLGVTGHFADIGYTAGISTNSNIRFLTNDNTRMYIQHNGHVGIGTTTPGAKLEVLGTTGLRIRSTTHSDAFMSLKGSESISSLNPGTTTSASIISGRPNGHLVIDISANDINDSFAVRTDQNTDGTVDHIAMVIKASGKVGIGSTNPGAILDVGKNINGGVLGTVFGRLGEGNSTGDGTFLGVRGYSSQVSAYDGKSFAIEHNFYGQTNNSINFFRGHSTTGGHITFNTNNNTEKVRIQHDGNVGIGTISPGEKLEVNGNALIDGDVYSKKIRVSANPGNWPDYVFEPGYKLRGLGELEKYIQVNKHLPEVPSAKQVEEQGQDLGEIQATLLKKVEELTLYLIEQDKKQESLEDRLNRLEQENTQLKKELKQLRK